MGREMTTYKETLETLNPETGELVAQSKYKSVKLTKEREDDYIKVYKYTNTVFAYKDIPLTLVPAVLEISKYMSYAETGQRVAFNKLMREEICETLGISINRLNQIVKELRSADVLRSTGARGVYAVNPFIVGAGHATKINELRAKFDFDAEEMRVEKSETNLITGKVVLEAVTEMKKNKQKQIPGQMSIIDADCNME